MSEVDTSLDGEQRVIDRKSWNVQSVVRKFGALNILAGLLGFVGPAMKGNDESRLINVRPGLFLGVVAVNGPHALLHVLFGALGVKASRDATSARQYMGFGAVLFGLFAAVGWRKFGFERGVHMIGGLAVDGWGNLGHTLISAFSLITVIQSDSSQ